MKIEISKQDENYVKLGSMFIIFSVALVSIPLIYFGLNDFITDELEDLMTKHHIVSELVSMFVLLVTCVMGGLLYLCIIIGCEIVKFSQQNHERGITQ